MSSGFGGGFFGIPVLLRDCSCVRRKRRHPGAQYSFCASALPFLVYRTSYLKLIHQHTSSASQLLFQGGVRERQFKCTSIGCDGKTTTPEDRKRSDQEGEQHATIPVDSAFGSFSCGIRCWIVPLRSTVDKATHSYRDSRREPGQEFHCACRCATLDLYAISCVKSGDSPCFRTDNS
jgi:hypothetical protein